MGLRSLDGMRDDLHGVPLGQDVDDAKVEHLVARERGADERGGGLLLQGVGHSRVGDRALEHRRFRHEQRRLLGRGGGPDGLRLGGGLRQREEREGGGV